MLNYNNLNEVINLKKKNIVIICFKYPPVYSGYGKQLKSVLDYILKNNHKYRFTILTAYEESLYANENINIIPMLNGTKSRSDIFKFSSKILSWLFINRKNINGLHCVKAGPEAVASNLFSKLFKIPLVIKIAQDEMSIRELNTGNILRRKIRKMRNHFLGTADHFIAISNEIDNNIKNYKSKTSQIHNIPNGVDIKKFSKDLSVKNKSKRVDLGFRKNEVIILYIGAINSRKGIPELLQSLKYLKTDLSVRVVLCGPILEELDFLNNIKKFNESSNNISIDYQGKVDNPELYMQCSDIFVLPSHSEGLPNVLLEAGSTGLSLIATDIGGSNEIVVNNYNGYIVPINNKIKIAESLNKLISNEDLRIKFGVNSRDHVVNKYSLDIVANKYIELYDKLTQTS